MPTWVLPATFAGLVAIAVTLVIERLGGKKGGLIGSLPTTIVPATAGIFVASESVVNFQDAMFITPAGMLSNAIFLLLWRVVPPRLPNAHTYIRLLLCILITLGGWICMAILAIQMTDKIHLLGITRNEWAIALTITMALLGILACKRNPPAPKATSNPGAIAIVSRGIMAAGAIGCAVWMAENGGPLIAGVAAVFPAIFMTTMCGLWLAHGETVGAGAVGPLMLGGTSVSAYAWLAAWWVPSLGIIPASIFAWLLSVIAITVPAWWWLNKQQ